MALLGRTLRALLDEAECQASESSPAGELADGAEISALPMPVL